MLHHCAATKIFIIALPKSIFYFCSTKFCISFLNKIILYFAFTMTRSLRLMFDLFFLRNSISRPRNFIRGTLYFLVRREATMSTNQISQKLSSIFDELNAFKRRLQILDAKYDELQVDCSRMVSAMRRLVASIEMSNAKKLSQISIIVDKFPRKHLTRKAASMESVRVNNS